MQTSTNVEQLRSFLRGEIAAVETYRMALEKIDRGSAARAKLETCQRSHQDRVAILRDAVKAHGGKADVSSGPWGVFAKAVEGGAKLLGEKVAIAALEEGEDHGLKDYQADIEKCDAETQQLVTSKLLPQQEQTHRMMSTLKKQLSS